MKGFFNTSAARETSSIWKFEMIPDDKQPEAPIILRELKFQDEKEGQDLQEKVEKFETLEDVQKAIQSYKQSEAKPDGE